MNQNIQTCDTGTEQASGRRRMGSESDDGYEIIVQRTSDINFYDRTITADNTAAASNSVEAVDSNTDLAKLEKSKSGCCFSVHFVIGFAMVLLSSLSVGIGIGYGIRISITADSINNNHREVNSDLDNKNAVLQTTTAADCSSIQGSNGRYSVNIGGTPLLVYCDLTTPGGGWLVFQRRINGCTHFFRNWTEYENGFGDLNDELWLGNKYLHQLTSVRNYKLRIDLQDFNGNARYAEYTSFAIGSAATNYKLTLSGYRGDAGDSLQFIGNGLPFSTFDADHDTRTGSSCSTTFKGAWWYNNCHMSNLNGAYLGGNHTTYGDGIEWVSWTGYQYSLKFTEMKMSSN